MDFQDHYRFLEKMYLQAPIVRSLYPKSSISIQKGQAVIECPAEPQYFHGGHSLHGSVYFRMLDDAAYFAASSLETSYFLLTADFNLRFLRPVSGGILRAEGRIITRPSDDDAKASSFKAEAVLYTEAGKIAAKGEGRFAKSRKRFSDI